MQQRYGPWLVGPRGCCSRSPTSSSCSSRRSCSRRPPTGCCSRWRRSSRWPPASSPSRRCRSGPRRPSSAGSTSRSPLQVADLNVGVLFVFAIASIGRLRHRAGRLGQQLQVLAARRAAQLGADDQLRAGLRHGPGHRGAAGRLDVVPRDRRRPDRLLLRSYPALERVRDVPVRAHRLPAVLHRRASPRPTARRSTSPKPSRSWSPATTPSTARCASPCSSWPSTSTWSRCRRWR